MDTAWQILLYEAWKESSESFFFKKQMYCVSIYFFRLFFALIAAPEGLRDERDPKQLLNLHPPIFGTNFD